MERKPSGYRGLLPVDPNRNQLRVLNSFTRDNDLFVSAQPDIINWYSCGPTVYDVAHLGHARCYITFDIIRRILANYFGYKVNYCMNITDVDDKIIKRARSHHLYEKFVQKLTTGSQSSQEFLAQVKEALDGYVNKFDVSSASATTDDDKAKVEMMKTTIDTSRGALEQLEKLLIPLSSTCSPHNTIEINQCLQKLKDVLAEDQDGKFGHTVHDHHIFKALTTKYEEEFHEDMRRLNVLPADSTPRVSEFIEEIGLYIQKLEANGFAYRADGSVYFDTDKFDADPKHQYAKLVREAYGHKKSLDGGEGELSQQEGKKSPNDFALWKKSKPGEPSWKVLDYEAGRPGWHIECSVMASHLLGDNFDIHSGGCDLKFPHHDNEIAQAEAYFNTGKSWVNFFLHSGHLSISGCKMSKSLKNFITIRQALERHSARQLRFAFLCHKWAGGLDYSDNTMREAIHYEKKFKEFFMNVIYVQWERKQLSGGDIATEDCEANRTAEDHQLFKEYTFAIDQIDKALCDNFDTTTVLKVLMGLVKECNKRPDTEVTLLKEISDYIERILSIFGACFDEMNADDMAAVFGYVKALAQFRADVRKLTKDKEILMLCDVVRDQTLPNLGVRLEDREGAGSLYKVRFVDPETLAEEKAQAEAEKKLKEEKAKLEKLRLQQQREDKMKMPPEEMFKNQLDKYSQFDETGMPTHDLEGKEISKSALKKLQRLYKDQKERYDKYIAEQQKQ